MSSQPKPGPKTGPNLSEQGEREHARRRALEAEALRANLLKRKAQARGRREATGEAAAPPDRGPGRPKA